MDVFQQTGKSSPDTALQDLTVLYVEDNQDVRLQLTSFLERRFGQVLVAKDGLQGLSIYQQQESSPDLVISDIRMPHLDGLSLVGLIREINPEQRIIMTTAHEETEYLLQAIDLGVDKFLLKPVNTRQLHTTLVQMASQVRAGKQLNEARLALQVSEERYRTLFWTAMDAFCLFDWATLEILEINRQHQQLFGYAQRELQGHSLMDLFYQQGFAETQQLLTACEASRQVYLANLVNAQAQAFPAEILVARLYSDQRELGLLTSRDASDRLNSMAEHQALVETLEMMLDSLAELAPVTPDLPRKPS